MATKTKRTKKVQTLEDFFCTPHIKKRIEDLASAAWHSEHDEGIATIVIKNWTVTVVGEHHDEVYDFVYNEFDCFILNRQITELQKFVEGEDEWEVISRR